MGDVTSAQALSFATTPHKSATEKAGDQLLGIKEHDARKRAAAARGGRKADQHDPLKDKYLQDFFGNSR